MKPEHLSKLAVKVWRIRLTIMVLLSTFLFGALGVINIKIAITLIFIISVLYVYIFLFYCVDRYNSELFYINSNVLYVEKGVYFKKKRIVFLDQIQYVTTVVSPEQRFFGVCTMYFFAAGNKTKISQIEYKKALDIKSRLGFK